MRAVPRYAERWDRQRLLHARDRYLRDCYGHRTAARVDEFARSILLSRWRLTTLFRRLVGATPLESLREQQIKFAKRLLTHTTYTNDEIAARSAFGTRNTFERVFTSRVGISPSEYRQRFATR
jgi:AraC-like DNA-binding protein